MKKGTLLLLALSLFLLGGCSAGITRYGYEIQDMNNGNLPADCQTAFKNNAAYEKDEVTVLGRIEAFDTGFSITCSESYILDIFRKDACRLGSDVVNITEERYPNFLSSCYRAKAEFLRLINRNKADSLVSDPKYSPQQIAIRDEEGAKLMRRAISAGVTGGLLGGLMVPH